MTDLIEKYLPSTPAGMVQLATGVAIIAVIGVYGFAYVFSLSHEEMYRLYFSQLRSNFFTGFLTVGSFMLSLKTFIVVKLKESVFDTESYRKIYADHKKRMPNLEYDKPLKTVSSVLFYSIGTAMITAIVHVTIGLFNGCIPFVICVFSVSFAFVMVLLSLCLIHLNIYRWLEQSKTA